MNYKEYTVKVYNDSYKEWYLNGKLHREDGPAIEWADGYKSWYLNGIEYSESEIRNATNPVKEYTMAELVALLGHPLKIIME